MIAYLVAVGSRINVRNKDGLTPLIAVAGTSRLDTVNFLVANGADINARGGQRQVLRKTFAQVKTATDNYGRTAMYMASFWGQLGTVRYLGEKGAAVDVEANNGWTPLFAAAAMHADSAAIVKYLHEMGAKVRLA